MLRTCVREKLTPLFRESADCDIIVTNLEKSIFNWAVRRTRDCGESPSWKNFLFVETYKRKFLTINYNLSHPQNNVKDKVVQQSIDEIQLPSFTPDELFPTGNYAVTASRLRSKEIEAEHRKGQVETTHVGIFTCGRCKSRKTTYYEMQTRSADEPMTAFITCLDCGKRWKS